MYKHTQPGVVIFKFSVSLPQGHKNLGQSMVPQYFMKGDWSNFHPPPFKIIKFIKIDLVEIDIVQMSQEVEVSLKIKWGSYASDLNNSYWHCENVVLLLYIFLIDTAFQRFFFYWQQA